MSAQVEELTARLDDVERLTLTAAVYGSPSASLRHIAHARDILARHAPESVPTVGPECGLYATCDHDECPVTGSVDFCSHCTFVLWDDSGAGRLEEGDRPPDEAEWPCADVRALCAAWGIEETP